MPKEKDSKPRRNTSKRYRYWQDSIKSIIEPGDGKEKTPSIDVGVKLREIRTKRGLSIRALAKIAGLNFNTLSLIENKKSSPSVSTLNQLAQALEVPITAFFEAESPQPEVVFQIAGERPQANFSHGLVEDLGRVNIGRRNSITTHIGPGSR